MFEFKDENGPKPESEVLTAGVCRCGTCKDAIDKAQMICQELKGSGCVIFGAVVTHLVQQMYANMISFGEVSEHGQLGGMVRAEFLNHQFHNTSHELMEGCPEYLKQAVLGLFDTEDDEQPTGPIN